MNFLNMVIEMRKYQREYFRTRTSESLQKAKEMERKVDQFISDTTKPNLFNS